ncbi:uncharacterized protein LOC110181492 [Drosophila serrata]|uniref:uncharacterized protein LOC110181492 n=1 Tax=Drosophila serrata TaxID=7274 RepID=UPI000A1D31C5|nr:uncharacterized protein LOC110181492 [Drosophila serrata]XP_020804914.1 uncharacterized protein LOC110181492 [Drosophila serrata]
MTSTSKMHILCLTVILWLLRSHPIAAFVNRYNRLPGYAQISSGGQDFLSGHHPHSSAGAAAVPAVQQQQQPSNQENLCSHCACTHLKAICDFQLNKTLSADWDSKYRVPVKIKSIEVYLRPSIEFRLFENFFQDNQVNYFGVNGVKDNDRVEVTRNAFSRNKGGYPNIEFRKVSQVYLQDRTLSAVEFKLLVEDTELLVVFPNAFTMANLDCTFRRIKDLQLNEKAFSHGGAQNGINLRVEDSTIDEIGRFDLSMSKVSFVRCNIGTIGRNAFDVTKIKELSFEQCNITTIKAQALTDKLHSENVSFVSTVIGTIEGEAINQSGITTLTLRGNTIDKIQSGAIRITAVDTFIHNNTVRHMEPNWLNVVQASQVEIENNRFGHFSRFEVNSAPIGALNCSFANNQLDDPQQGSLNFSRCGVHRISVGRICSCDGSAWLKTLTDHDLDSEILCPLKSEDHSCFNATTVDRRRFEHEACGGNGTRHCSEGLWMTQSGSDQLSGTASPLSITWVSCIVVVATCIVSFVIYVGFVCVPRLRPSGGGQARQRKCAFSEEAKRQLLLAAEKHSENDQTRKAINKLIKNGPFTEDECLTRICEIVQHIPHKSSSIKDLLSNHLTECHESGSPMSASGGDYGMSTIGAGGSMDHPPHHHNHIAAPSAPSAYECGDYDNDEPIYQEPDQQQRPLIPSEYSELPPQAEDPYSEPFNATNANDMPPAYQYATPMRHPRPQPPSTTTTVCYASPVWRSTPSAIPTSRPPSGAGAGAGAGAGVGATAPRHVRDLRQDLEAMPQFHPNQLTSARNQRQLQQNYPQTQSQSQPQAQSQSQSQSEALAHPHPPPYSQPGIRRHRSRQSFECLDGAASLAAMEHMDSGSDHSGGSDVTVQITDVIDYADA